MLQKFRITFSIDVKNDVKKDVKTTLPEVPQILRTFGRLEANRATD